MPRCSRNQCAGQAIQHLGGSTPFESETLKKAGFDEMRRMVREVDPPPPSLRLSTLKNKEASTVTECRQVEVRQLWYTIRFWNPQRHEERRELFLTFGLILCVRRTSAVETIHAWLASILVGRFKSFLVKSFSFKFFKKRRICSQ